MAIFRQHASAQVKKLAEKEEELQVSISEMQKNKRRVDELVRRVIFVVALNEIGNIHVSNCRTKVYEARRIQAICQYLAEQNDSL